MKTLLVLLFIVSCQRESVEGSKLTSQESSEQPFSVSYYKIVKSGSGLGYEGFLVVEKYPKQAHLTYHILSSSMTHYSFEVTTNREDPNQPVINIKSNSKCSLPAPDLADFQNQYIGRENSGHLVHKNGSRVGYRWFDITREEMIEGLISENCP